MNDRRSMIVGLCVAVGALALATGVLHAREQSRSTATLPGRGVYFRSPEALSRLFLSFDALAADVYWMRAIQHYGRGRQSTPAEGRFALLEPLLDITTTLDPRFSVAYRFGAIFLALEPPNGAGRPDQAIRLLEKGLSTNPDRWQYAHDIGFVHYWHTGRFDLAADAFTRATTVPGAPTWLGPLAAVTRARGGDREGARRLLTELVGSDEAHIRQAAERGLAQLRALDDLDRLSALIAEYGRRTGRDPESLESLADIGLIEGTPVDPSGRPYVYVPGRTVGLSADSPLLPLPRTLKP